MGRTIMHNLSELLGWLDGAAYRTTRIVRLPGSNIETFRADPQILTRELRRLEERFQTLARRADPLIATDPYVDADDPALTWLINETFFPRFSWTLAVTAGGTERTAELARDCYIALGKWWACWFVLQSVTRDHSLPATASYAEQLHRISSQQIRYLWASQEICLETAILIESDSDLASRLPEVTYGAVTEVFDSIQSYAECGRFASSSGARQLMKALSVAAGSRRGRPLEEVLHSREMYARPWVADPRGAVWPTSGYAAMSMENPLLDLVDDRTVNLRRKAPIKGDLFERVAEQCVARALNSRPTSDQRPLKVHISASNEGELDLVLGHPVQVIGECKARRPPSGVAAIDSAFVSDVEYGIEQLELRLTALRNGAQVVDSARTHFAVDPSVKGIVVTMHPYAGSNLDPFVRGDVGPAGKIVSHVPLVADLHTWIIVLRALGSVGEFQRYLDFRRRLERFAFAALDETDLLILYLNPNRERIVTNMAVKTATYSKAIPSIGGCAVDIRNALLEDAPSSPHVWRERLYAQASFLG
jgi:hypothetical protein